MRTLAIPQRSSTALDQLVHFPAQDTKNALVNSSDGFFVYESHQCFQSQSEFTKSKRSFGSKTSALEPFQVDED